MRAALGTAVVAILFGTCVFGCGDGTSGSDGGADAGGQGSGGGSTSGSSAGGTTGDTTSTVTPGDAQTPPTGTAESIDAWLAEGSYKSWACEDAPQAARGVSPHGRARICSNTLLSQNEAAEYPVGAAGVKELFPAGSDTPNGLAVYLKVQAGKGGAGWYWYERLNGTLFANGLGDSGTEKTSCVGCHDGAPKDQVFTQVR